MAAISRRQSSPQRPARRGAVLIVLMALVALLAGCGAPASEVALPSQVPAAAALAQVFPSQQGTPSAPALRSQPAAPMPTPAAPTPAVMTDDPFVDADCIPPAVQPAGAAGPGKLSFDVAVDASPTGRTISPLIYGLGVASEHSDWYRDLGIRLVRWGGNHTTRENWEINASNAGSDWSFANVDHGWPDMPAGGVGDNLANAARSIGADAVLTIPTIGWVANNGDNATKSAYVPTQGGPRLAQDSDAIAGYDPSANRQATAVQSFASKGAPFVYPPDPNDQAVYQDEWIDHLVKSFGRADAGGVRFYALDNEPDLWSSTHRDVHPVRMGYDEMLALWEEYATAIKDVDPSAQIVAPVLSGVTPMFYSELDRGGDNFDSALDRASHGGQPFLRWFLEEARIRDEQAGRRRLDYVDVHFYPQNGVYPGGSEQDTNALRLRSTQELWDPNYTSESWIARTEAAKLGLIPRLRDWVATHYPGTKIAITEWNFGADDTINGGLTIADVLGIFGREGVDMAAYWYYPAPGGPGASAFKLYGNYDSCGRHFGDQVLKAQSADEQSLGVYAARDSYSGDTTVMLINKLPNTAIDAKLALVGFDPGTVEVYQFNGDHAAIRRLADLDITGEALTYTVPQYSATLLVFKQKL